MTMHLHLENYQSISFTENQTLQDILANERNSTTMLIEFFSMNRTNKRAQDLNCLYKEFPRYFTWDEGDRIWIDRKRGEVISHVNTAHPIEEERYYLRMLLMHVRKPTSFDDLKSADAHLASSYKEAAELRGLLQADNGFDVCLSKQQVQIQVLRLIDQHIQIMEKDISDYKLTDIPYHLLCSDNSAKEIEVEYQIHISNKDLASISMLNRLQKFAFDKIMEKVNANVPVAFFIDGPSGTGKSFLYKALLATVRSRGHIVLATTTFGATTSLLPGGCMAHSRFKIPLHQENRQTCNISKQSNFNKLLKLAKLIIWDEAAIVKKYAIESFGTMLHDILHSDIIFGGKIIVFGGNF
ncbi:uncharacterized protein [Coffea arabica]|uniref:ATP-dependent DNA helicase n=1 Tax=Coffea arabica TaxID=13443 RepID=A0A6P6T0J5_COFAR|nr:uncharacterized protein LOC113696650 [Coffea arabica]